MGLEYEVEGALEAAERGNFRDVDALMARLDGDPSDGAASLRVALRAVRWLSGLESAMPVGSAPSPVEGASGAHARRLLVRCAWLGFDAEAMHVHVEALGRAQDVGERARLDGELHRALVELDADPAAAVQRAREVGQQASRAGLAAIVVDATSVRALAALATGDFDEATASARRASRMARTEGLPQPEYLANLVLARVRRLTGRPHLATRILAGLSKVAPPSWASWIAWERMMAGGQIPSDPSVLGSAVVAGLAQLLDAAIQGDEETFEVRGKELQTLVAAWPLLRFDVELLRGATRLPVGDAVMAKELAEWRRGDREEPPFGVATLGVLSDDPSTERSVGRVVVRPGAAGSRVLWLGHPLYCADCAVLEPLQRQRSRTDSALAVLALAGPAGVDEEQLFARVYGFPYKPGVHRDVLHVLIHRARARASELGEIERDGAQLTLRLESGAVIPDPRCAPPVDDRVLQFIARAGRTSARKAAQQLGVPLRSVQAALKVLVDEGACDRERSGGHVEYKVEDTTFQEPTRVGGPS